MLYHGSLSDRLQLLVPSQRRGGIRAVEAQSAGISRREKTEFGTRIPVFELPSESHLQSHR